MLDCATNGLLHGFPHWLCFWNADRVFGSDATTLEIYEAHTKDIIGSAVQGFNGNLSVLRLILFLFLV
jgi:hypothetical protein